MSEDFAAVIHTEGPIDEETGLPIWELWEMVI